MTVKQLTFNGFPGKPKDQTYPIPGMAPVWTIGEQRLITEDYVRQNGWSLSPDEVVDFVVKVFNDKMPKDKPPFTVGTADEKAVKKDEADRKRSVNQGPQNVVAVAAVAPSAPTDTDQQPTKEKE